jgi:hypothetical protein
VGVTQTKEYFMNYITDEHRRAFEKALSPFDRVALVSCLVDGEPSAAIACVDDYAEPPIVIRPLFVAVTKRMTLVFAVPETKGD